MKPDWDKLALEAHSSVFIGDINCSEQEELCSQQKVTGYPTIKVYKSGATVEDYSGGRSFEQLAAYVDTELAEKCNISKLKETCSEKAAGYFDKWKPKDADAIKKELGRLTGMSDGSMTADLKSWLRERMTILQQLSAGGKDEL
jgi:thioredoxin-like negative regulator of GroEL